MRRIVSSFILLLLPISAFAAGGNIDIVTSAANDQGGQTYSISIQILALMTVMTFLPAMLLMMTSFTRIVIVLGIMRQAIGTAQTPTNQILVGMGVFLTMFIMAPVFERIYTEAVVPYMEESIDHTSAMTAAMAPMKEFMLAQTREDDLILFVELSGNDQLVSREDVPMTVLIPAFVTSELKTAFQMGFMIFIPFLVIDMVVSSILMAMGMMMLSPMIVSVPFKIMLFVLVDGWTLIIGSLAASFY